MRARVCRLETLKPLSPMRLFYRARRYRPRRLQVRARVCGLETLNNPLTIATLLPRTASSARVAAGKAFALSSRHEADMSWPIFSLHLDPALLQAVLQSSTPLPHHGKAA